MAFEHWEISVDPEHGSDILLVAPAAGGGYRPSEAQRVSAELFYEFVVPGFQARRVPIWDNDLGDWLLSPMSVNQ